MKKINKNNEVEVVIGLEIHIELKTKLKMFSNSLALSSFVNKEKLSLENYFINEVDLGYPGTLPIVNKEAVKLGLILSTVLGMRSKDYLLFDRKNYFYFDLPKGYQITQFHHPLAEDGKLLIQEGNQTKEITIKQIHLEEDTAKYYKEKNHIHLNYNRCGNPLIELITTPCFSNSNQVILFLQKLIRILKFYNISDAQMHNGNLRCDVNISTKYKNKKKLNKRTEIKNLVSFEKIKSAIEYETTLQKNILLSGGVFKTLTKKYSEKERKTIILRKKKSISEYHYLSEVNLPKILIDKEWKENIKKSINKNITKTTNSLNKLKFLKKNEIDFLLDKKVFLKLFTFFLKEKKEDIKKFFIFLQQNKKQIEKLYSIISSIFIYLNILIFNSEISINTFWKIKDNKIFEIIDKSLNNFKVFNLIILFLEKHKVIFFKHKINFEKLKFDEDYFEDIIKESDKKEVIKNFILSISKLFCNENNRSILNHTITKENNFFKINHIISFIVKDIYEVFVEKEFKKNKYKIIFELLKIYFNNQKNTIFKNFWTDIFNFNESILKTLEKENNNENELSKKDLESIVEVFIENNDDLLTKFKHYPKRIFNIFMNFAFNEKKISKKYAKELLNILKLKIS